MAETLLSIGSFAKRAGVAASALRFYEDEGLIRSTRTSGGQRQYTQETLRRVGFIRVAQGLGLSLADIRAALDTLPERRTPTKSDWEKLSRSWRPLIQARIDAMTALRDQLTSCIGCGCLSLKTCKLYNPGDVAEQYGSGPRYLMGNRPSGPVVLDEETEPVVAAPTPAPAKKPAKGKVATKTAGKGKTEEPADTSPYRIWP